MDGSKLKPTKKLSKNLINYQGQRKVYCPICIIREDTVGEKIYMVKNEGNMICPKCKYVVPLKLPAPTESTLEAGNEIDASNPYMKSIGYMTPKRSLKNVPDVYNNPLDAWQSEP